MLLVSTGYLAREIKARQGQSGHIRQRHSHREYYSRGTGNLDADVQDVTDVTAFLGNVPAIVSVERNFG